MFSYCTLRSVTLHYIQLLYINTRRRSQRDRNITVVSNVNLKFVVGCFSFYTCCRKGSGIQVNVVSLNKRYLQKGKIVDAIK
jgi:hypothetical protein